MKDAGVAIDRRAPSNETLIYPLEHHHQSCSASKASSSIDDDPRGSRISARNGNFHEGLQMSAQDDHEVQALLGRLSLEEQVSVMHSISSRPLHDRLLARFEYQARLRPKRQACSVRDATAQGHPTFHHRWPVKVATLVSPRPRRVQSRVLQGAASTYSRFVHAQLITEPSLKSYCVVLSLPKSLATPAPRRYSQQG